MVRRLTRLPRAPVLTRLSSRCAGPRRRSCLWQRNHFELLSLPASPAFFKVPALTRDGGGRRVREGWPESGSQTCDKAVVDRIVSETFTALTSF